MNPSVVLASSSPYRQMLLKQVGLHFESHPARVDERVEESLFLGTVDNLAQSLAVKKALSLVQEFPNAWIIGSDQVLIYKKRTLSKPTTHEEVIDRLRELNGQTHRLSTGLAVVHGQTIYQTTVTADLKMHQLDQEEIENYARLDQPLGCAGGYKIESHGPRLFESIVTKDYHSIIGLPLLELCTYLRNQGIFRL